MIWSRGAGGRGREKWSSKEKGGRGDQERVLISWRKRKWLGGIDVPKKSKKGKHDFQFPLA